MAKDTVTFKHPRLGTTLHGTKEERDKLVSRSPSPLVEQVEPVKPAAKPKPAKPATKPAAKSEA